MHSLGGCQLCPGQAHRSPGICHGCWQDLPWLAPGCLHCGLPLNTLTCLPCQARPFAFDRVDALFEYQFPLKSILIQFKYQKKLYWASWLANMMWTHFQWEGPDCVIPVPMSTARLRQRGYNQSLEMARYIAKWGQVPLISQGCTRVNAKQTQTQLNVKHRALNVIGAFKVSENFHNAHVLVIDDVMTTGQTLHRLSQALKRKGASRVSAWLVCRTC